MAEAQQPIDLVTLTSRLRDKCELGDAGGAAYLAQLIDGVPRISNLEHYARITKEKAFLRNLIHAAHAIQKTAFEAEEDVGDIVDRARLHLEMIRSCCIT
jgi:replicative DNA helicase